MLWLLSQRAGASWGQRMGFLVWGSCPSVTTYHRGSVNSSSLGSGPGPTFYGVRDFGQVSLPLLASVSPCVRWEYNSTVLGGLP